MKNLNELLNEEYSNANIKSGKDKDVEAWLRKNKPIVKISELAFDFIDYDEWGYDSIIDHLPWGEIISKAEFTEEIKKMLKEMFGVNPDDVICFKYWQDDDNEKICIAYATYNK